MYGIDVSKHQGLIDWKKAHKHIDFAIIRAGYGTSIDAKAERNVFYCERYKIPFGLYWFSYATTEKQAVKEAETLLEFIGDRKIPLPIWFDYEYESDQYAKSKGKNITKELRTRIAEAFCSRIEHEGYYVGIYANLDYVYNYFDARLFKRYDLWLAAWVENQPFSVSIWQYTNKGNIEGITGDVDMNKCNADLINIIKNKKLNNT